MNSTLQALSNTPGLTDYFLREKFSFFKSVNLDNPLGYNGKVAKEYGAFINEVWGDSYTCVAPKKLKVSAP